MRAEIISVGTELLLGDIVNTNAQYLARELASLGFVVYYQSVVGDNPMRLKSLVYQAKERCEVLVFTGGLGPTDDDLTKETVAEAFGDTLVSDPEEMAKLEIFFKKLGRPMADNNRKQAMVPRRGKKLENQHGTAPGVMFRQGNKFAFLLPGPPREMRPMFENEVQPLLEAMQDGALRSHSLHVVGIGESDLEVKLKDFVGGSNPTVALYAKDGEVHVRVTAKAQTPEQADYMSREMANLLCQVLGDVVYSDDDSNLQQTVVSLLEENGESVALAESCTGGLLAERLTSVSGASAVFGYGAVSYANEFKRKMLRVRNRTLTRYGAVSSQVCAEMAFGAAKQGIADYGVGITGIAGPGGGSEEKPVGLVYVGVSSGKQVWVRKLNIPDRNRDYVRYYATQVALDMLRRVVLDLDVPGAKCFAENQLADFEREGRAQWRGAAILRILAAGFLALLFMAAVVLVAYFGQLGGQETGTVLLPSQRGLQYGSEEYTEAVHNLIEEEKQVNPSVSGFIALPNGLVESFVVESQEEQADLLFAEELANFEDMAVFGKNATFSDSKENILLTGGRALRPIMELAESENMDKVSSFSCYTENEVLEYLVFAVVYLEDEATQADNFDPSLLSLDSYSEYLPFVLGAKGRSIYTIPLDVQEDDSFMTLRTQDPDVPGQSLLLFGRLRRPGEDLTNTSARPAGQALMPENYYEEQGYPMPSLESKYEEWFIDYLSEGVNNLDLQLSQGMPAEDVAPSVVLYPDVEEDEESEESTAEESGEEAGSEETPPEEVVLRSIFNEEAVSVEKALQGDTASSQEITRTTPPALSTSLLAESGNTSSSSQPVSSAAPATTSSSGTSVPAPTTSVTNSLASSLQSTLTDTPLSEVPTNSIVESEAQVTPVIQRPDPRFLVVRMNGILVRDTVSNVLAAICQYEMAGAPTEAIQAQAIVVHSWILNQQGSGNPAPAVRAAAPSQEMRSLVEEVDSLVLSADGYNPAFTPWFVSAAGGTNSSADLFSIERSYLQEIPAENEDGMSEVQQVVELSEEEMRALLSSYPKLSTESLGDVYTWFSELVHNESGYVVSFTLAGETLSGLELWQDVLQENGEALMQSLAFHVDYNGNVFRLTAYGEGHGCGLSQTGAIQFAQEDAFTSEQILAHYFPETELIEWV